MKIGILHIILLTILWMGCETKSNVEPHFEDYFIKYYGGEGNQSGVDFVILNDGFALLGTSQSNDGSNVSLMRTDELGNELWTLNMGGNSIVANAMEVDPSGNFVIAATNTISANDKDIVVFRIGAEGNKLDSLAFGSVGEVEEANDITLTQGGDIIVIGSTTDVDINKPGYMASTDLEDIYSIRLDPNFVPYEEADWRRISGFPGIDRGHNILEKLDGTFLFFGTTNRPPSSSQQEGFNMFLYPAGNDGQAISVTQLQLFGTLSDEFASQMVKTADGGFVMVGTSNNSNENDIYLARVRSNNEFLSAGLLNSGKNLIGVSILESGQGGLLLLGRDIINNTGNISLIKTTVSGAILWEKSFGGVDNDNAGMVKELPDGSIVLVGTIDLESQTKICLIKTTNNGELKK